MNQQHVLQFAHKDNTMMLLKKVAIVVLLTAKHALVQQTAHVNLIFF